MAIPFPTTSLLPTAPEPCSENDILDELRERLTNDLHMGRARAGDRLPSIRRVARDNGVDHRAVARAYRSLEEEGLVEIRGRSGVWVAHGAMTEVAPTPPLGEQGWLAEMLAESWLRAVSSARLRRMLLASADAADLRCACVESNEDQMQAYCTEIGELTGMRMIPVAVASGESGGASLARLRAGLREADLVVTTQFHAAAIREALRGVATPMVVLRVNPELAEAVRRRLVGPGMTVVAATEEFGERLRHMYESVIVRDDQLRVVLARDTAAVRRLDPAEPVLLTRAARALLPDIDFRTLVFPHSPTIAPESVLELAGQIVRLIPAPSEAAALA